MVDFLLKVLFVALAVLIVGFAMFPVVYLLAKAVTYGAHRGRFLARRDTILRKKK